MKKYLNAVGLFVFISTTIGYVVPNLVSSKDSFLVLAGFGWLLLSPLVVWYWVKKAFGRKNVVKS